MVGVRSAHSQSGDKSRAVQNVGRRFAGFRLQGRGGLDRFCVWMLFVLVFFYEAELQAGDPRGFVEVLDQVVGQADAHFIGQGYT